MTLKSETIKAEALRLGFSACGIAVAAPLDEAHTARYKSWLANGCHGDMDYLSRGVEMRLNPKLLVEGAESVVSLAMNYFPEREMSPGGYTFARYAYGRDYHDVVRERLRRLMQALGLTEFVDGRIFCDTAPIDERYWAVQAGIGWTGRSGQLILPSSGTYFFLGEMVLTHKVDVYDTPIPARCGTCRRCIEACPTGALRGDGTLDARKCLSYLTIEHRGEIPVESAEKMGNCIYGCDRCSEACPWNSFASPTTETAFAASEALLAMSPSDWSNLSPEQYRALFKGSAVKRAKYEGLVRNVEAVKRKNE